jgi:hypothetical protein
MKMPLNTMHVITVRIIHSIFSKAFFMLAFIAMKSHYVSYFDGVGVEYLMNDN